MGNNNEDNLNLVVGKIHPNDDMLFKLNGKPIKESYTHYNSVGLSALHNIEEALSLADKKFENIKHCLDLPCGYGRVLRLLCERIDPNRITACEVNQEAVEFCNHEFGTEPLVSNCDLRKVNFKRKYDLIWVGSLFTHLKQDSFSTLLEVLYDILEDYGVLVFTTHGYHSLELDDKQVYGVKFPEKQSHLKILTDKGFHYIAYEHSKEYGISTCSPEYVFLEVKRVSDNNMRLIMYKFKGWDNHQDVYSFQKIKLSG